eukprot:s6179_g2.t1
MLSARYLKTFPRWKLLRVWQHCGNSEGGAEHGSWVHGPGRAASARHAIGSRVGQHDRLVITCSETETCEPRACKMDGLLC